MSANLASAQKLAAATQAKAQLIKLITFDIGKLNLAVRIDQPTFRRLTLQKWI